MNALNLVKQSLLVALLYSFGTLGGTIAQELPICTHQYYDADGDGFGWQNEASCLITSSSEPPPSFTNKSTGEPVTLVRPYWDGNTDIANRAIRCDRYDYQPASGDYQRPTDSFNTLPDLILTHQSISTSRKYTPFVGIDQDQEYYGWYTLDREGVELLYDSPLQTFGMPLWRTNDGLYENDRPYSDELLQAPYIEIVNPQGVRAIRIWFNEGDRFNTAYDFIDNIHNTEGYFQCYDESGADFGPTGQIGTPSATPEPALQELALSGQSNDWYESDGVVNLATGEPVPLVKANWNYNNDIAGRLIQCDEYGFDPVCNSAGYGKGCGFAAVEPLYYMMPWHLTDSTSNHGANLHWWSRFSGVRNNRKFGYSDGSITPGIEQARIPIFLRTELVELLNDNKVRIWQEATDNGHEKYHECTVYPTGTADSATTNTESTSTASDGSNDQTDGSNTQTSGSDSNTQTEENNPSETSDTTNTSMTLPENTQANDETSSVTSVNSGGGSIDTWIMFLLLSVLRLNVSSLVLAILLSVGGTPYSFAQSLPVCSAQFYDADGDGFGWENSASCVVTESSIPAPVFFDKELNQQVELSRVYWDGNTDIANRMIQCDRFHFDENQQRYTFVDYAVAQDPQTYESAGASEFRYFHQPIPPGQPFVGWLEAYLRTDGDFNKRASRAHPMWTIEDGRYIGAGILNSAYFEIAARSNGSKSVKRWFNSGDNVSHGIAFWSERMTDDGFFECYDPSGSDFSPTGQQGVVTTSPAPEVADITVRVEAESEAPTNIIDLETGLPVEFAHAVWNYNDDIALKRITCYDMLENGDSYTQDFVFGREEFYPQIGPETRSVDYWTSFNDNARLSELSFSENFTVFAGSGEIFESAFVEVVEGDNTSIRIWYETGPFAHKRCSALDHNYMPTDLRPTGGNTEETTADNQTTENNGTDTENDTSGVTGNDLDESSDNTTADNNEATHFIQTDPDQSDNPAEDTAVTNEQDDTESVNDDSNNETDMQIDSSGAVHSALSGC